MTNNKIPNLLVAALKDREMVEDKATAFVCSNFSCKPPIIESKELKKLLSNSL